ncbi:MAG: glycosyltransferase family 4 protein [Ignavibacteriaceae bacterium]|nr:glycosyltransferase family 4 protein [Ignavibacteriaceae bacterium]
MISVLINAYACAPNMGSEPGMAWNWVVNLSKYCKVFVITEGEWQKEIGIAIKELPQIENISFYYIPVSEKIRKMCWNQGDWRFYFYYHKWQKKALAKAKEICESQNIHILHQLNMIGYREPGLLWKIKNIPLVWGPVGGFGGIPLSYTFEFGLKGAIKQILKNLINRIQVYQPNIYMSVKKAHLILAANTESKLALQRFRSDEVFLINETGANQIKKESKNFNTDPLKLIWIGKNDNRKAFPLALSVMKNLIKYPIELHVIGIEKSNVDKSLLVDLKKVYFYARMTHKEVQEHLSKCHVLFFTSLNEGTPHAVIEALSNGLPVICHDVYGQGDVINKSCGIKIKMINPKRSIEEFSKEIIKLFSKREILEKLSEGAYSRAFEISWENKITGLINLYTRLLKQHRN